MKDKNCDSQIKNSLFPNWDLNVDNDDYDVFILDYFGKKKLLCTEDVMIECLKSQKNTQELYWASLALRKVGTNKSIKYLKNIVTYGNLDVQGASVMSIAKLANGSENEFLAKLLLNKKFRAKWYVTFAFNYKPDTKAVPYALEYGLKTIKSSKNKPEAGSLIVEYLARFAPENEQSKKIFARINKDFENLSPREKEFFSEEFPNIFICLKKEMKIKENISLKNYNTFRIDVKASRFITINSIDELQKLLETEKDLFLLGGGSNMLLTTDINKLVVHLNIKGISIENEGENNVFIKVNAGEVWHNFVLWCVDKNYGGIENLSLIPGNVGTCPVQNIGAYGVEVKDVIHKVNAIEIDTNKITSFTNEECNFGYRNSIFKNKVKGKYIITSVVFKLTKNNHKLNISYGAIKEKLDLKNIENPTLKNISDAVISIREEKLPNPKEIGNSGSFFKNPIISAEHFKSLKEEFTDIPRYKISEDEIKIPAGWLIEQSGFKGKRFGNCGVHEKQALVLVNYGGATGKEIRELSERIKQKIKETFNINLEVEVNII